MRSIKLLSILGIAAVATLGASPRAGHAATTHIALHPAISMLDAVAFVDAHHGWVAGAGILATTDGGHTWTRQNSPVPTVLALDFVDAANGWALGQTSTRTSVLLHTTDGGRHWRLAAEPTSHGAGVALQSIQFRDALHGVGVATPMSGGYIGNYASSVFATADGGQSWQAHPTPGAVTSACFADTRHGWAVEANGDAIIRSMDGGHSWTRQLDAGPEFRFGGTISCLSSSAAWALLYGGVGMNQESYALYRTTDGGAHWSAVVATSTAGGGPAPGPTGHAPAGPGINGERLSAVDANTARMIGGCAPCGMGTTTFGGTSDGGQSWRNLPVPGITYSGSQALSFPSRRCGWIVTNSTPFQPNAQSQGIILATTDGGHTWTRQ